jgi:mitotic spindle assembly checkpoint protein MAD2
VFNVENEKPTVSSGGASTAAKAESVIAKEIAAILRQITASTSFLPLLDAVCTFDLLVYTDAAEVQLRSFSTSRHKINTSVAYKLVDFAEG